MSRTLGCGLFVQPSNSILSPLFNNPQSIRASDRDFARTRVIAFSLWWNMCIAQHSVEWGPPRGKERIGVGCACARQQPKAQMHRGSAIAVARLADNNTQSSHFGSRARISRWRGKCRGVRLSTLGVLTIGDRAPSAGAPANQNQSRASTPYEANSFRIAMPVSCSEASSAIATCSASVSVRPANMGRSNVLPAASSDFGNFKCALASQ
jgi:hypothetical protein